MLHRSPTIMSLACALLRQYLAVFCELLVCTMSVSALHCCHFVTVAVNLLDVTLYSHRTVKHSE